MGRVRLKRGIKQLDPRDGEVYRLQQTNTTLVNTLGVAKDRVLELQNLLVIEKAKATKAKEDLLLFTHNQRAGLGAAETVYAEVRVMEIHEEFVELSASVVTKYPGQNPSRGPMSPPIRVLLSDNYRIPIK